VVGYTDLLESSGLEMNETEFQAALRGLHTGSGRLVGLVEDFLLLSQLRAGAIANEIAQASPIPIDPDPIVHHVAAQAQNRAAARNVSLVVECTTSSAAVAISGQHLAEIASRLLDNAIKFSKTEGGQVEIACRQTANSWELSIKDHGIGIRHEAFAWLFEAFQQVDRGELEQQGAGVGLAIVRGLVEVYGGRIAVDSTLGKGTTFAVQLPLATE
jgi:cell cycle sensor histidine kinase DivJ